MRIYLKVDNRLPQPRNIPLISDFVFLQNLLEDGRAGDPEVEVGGEAGGQEELHLLQVDMDPHVQLQPDQHEDNQAVRGVVVFCCCGIVVVLLWCCCGGVLL